MVENLAEKQQYVAKKIILGGMTEREIRGSHQEAELLRRLDHPNIVKYKESFCEEGQLIIVMEYCKIGDLTYHIKQKAKAKEPFTETEIMNWFVQMCMALKYIHSQGILHRDIKASNIYLTGNNTVKLGDFGISRILQGSEAAMTVVGTPYYMSPEVCENKPYSYKSDTWSLGCVLYELCTLKHAFSADNLLGLVFKIVTERAEPIPNNYSPQLRQIVQNILVKDSAQRISISDILRDPYVVSYMRSFVDTNGESLTTVRSLNVRRTSVQVNEPPSPNETPKQKMERNKREKAEKEAELLKQAAREAHATKQISKQRKQDMLYSSPVQRAQNQAIINKALSTPSNLSGSGSTIASLVFTNQKSYERSSEDVAELTESFNFTRTQDLNTEENYRNFLKYTQHEPEDTLSYSDTFESAMYTNNLIVTNKNRNEDRPIRASGQYNLSFIEDESPEIAENNPEELTQVLTMYINQMSHPGRLESIEELSRESRESSPGLSPKQPNKRESMRKQCVETMGEDLFNEFYQFLIRQRQLETPDDIILEEVKKRWGRRATDYCFLVDQLIFIELFQ